MGIKRALLSTWDKTGLVDFATELAKRDVALMATGGTLKTLREAGLAVEAVEDVTGHAEMLGGRVKTLHPAVHAGILARRADREAGIGKGYQPIDLVVVNLYPFEAALRERGPGDASLVEMIDIGGPTMLRASAKNWDCVTVLSDPSQYDSFLAELDEGGGEPSAAFRKRMAAAVFEKTQSYDAAIAAWMKDSEEETAPARLSIALPRERELRYGENPHQAAALYVDASEPSGIASAEVMQGKPLSYNNLLDADAAFDLLVDLANGQEMATAVVVKHLGPCGAAYGERSGVALERALSCDPVSAFGGVIAFSQTVDARAAQQIVDGFYEIVIAPGYDGSALDLLSKKKNMRVLRTELPPADGVAWRVRGISGGVLLQQKDNVDLIEPELRVATERQPTEDEWAAMRFGWRICKHVRSNAIVFSASDRVLASGGGQPNRVGACRLAMARAAELGHDLKGSALASDAFFPFRDTVDVAHEAGATCVIQPGGSIRDEESIEAANEYGMAMVLTGVRHFRH